MTTISFIHIYRALSVHRVRVIHALPTCLAMIFTVGSIPAVAQNYFQPAQNYFQDYPKHSTEMKALQPSWTAALVTANPDLVQLFRQMIIRQVLRGRNEVMNIGNASGLQVILSHRVEFDAAIPNYAIHNDSKTLDGFGDSSINTKFRMFSGNQAHGNYIVTAMIRQSWTTGTNSNGASASSRAYTLAGGKAFGRLDVQSTGGVGIPSANLSTLGRPVAWNSVLQLHAAKKVWMEVESNSTYYHLGKNDGKMQEFVTPGVIVTQLRPRGWSEKSPTFAFGSGMQIATSKYHASNHNLIFDARLVY
jgi:hypothetical protein